jgi:hypothetical protein
MTVSEYLSRSTPNELIISLDVRKHPSLGAPFKLRG